MKKEAPERAAAPAAACSWDSENLYKSTYLGTYETHALNEAGLQQATDTRHLYKSAYLCTYETHALKEAGLQQATDTCIRVPI